MGIIDENRETQLLNLCLVVKANERLFDAHDTTFAKEDRIKANDILMPQDGVEAWLRVSSTTLSGSFRESLASPLARAVQSHLLNQAKPSGIADVVDVDRWVID